MSRKSRSPEENENERRAKIRELLASGSQSWRASATAKKSLGQINSACLFNGFARSFSTARFTFYVIFSIYIELIIKLDYNAKKDNFCKRRDDDGILGACGSQQAKILRAAV